MSVYGARERCKVRLTTLFTRHGAGGEEFPAVIEAGCALPVEVCRWGEGGGGGEADRREHRREQEGEFHNVDGEEDGFFVERTAVSVWLTGCQ
jgi:hypothetical protein